MNSTELHLIHLKAATIQRMIIEEQAKISVCYKMIRHAEGTMKDIYQEQADNAEANFILLNKKYMELMKELTEEGGVYS